MPDDQLPPPGAESDKAQRYVDSLIRLIGNEKVLVTQTDLKRYNSPSMEDHYRINLKDYDIELSHNKNPETSEETYIMIFNSIGLIDPQNPQPVVLAYVHLEMAHFMRLKQAADSQIEKIRKAKEEARFKATMQPIEQLLDQMGNDTPPPPHQPSSSQPEQPQSGQLQPQTAPTSPAPEQKTDEENSVNF